MKKISAAVVKARKNFSQPKLTIGLDLGDRSSWYCVLDEAGEVRLEQKLSTTPKAMGEVFGAKSSSEGKIKAQSRVSVTALMAWPASVVRWKEVDNQVAAPAETGTPNLHRANQIAHRRVRMEGWRQWQRG